MGLRSNQAIGAIKALGSGAMEAAGWLSAPMRASAGLYRNGAFMDAEGKAIEGMFGRGMAALKAGHSTGGQLDYGKVGKSIAGSYMSVSAGYRIASGGGVYRDSSGNADLIGIPFL